MAADPLNLTYPLPPVHELLIFIGVCIALVLAWYLYFQRRK
jgi:hypothetical protein